ncbi:MAG: rubrerythrin family protein [Oscillospiraceae bacterium]
MNIEGIKSEENLLKAFKGESEDFTRYMIFSDKAKKEGYYQISKLFEEIAFNEKEHAELWLEYLGELGDTLENLKKCAEKEMYETSVIYPEFAKIAEQEGFEDLVTKFCQVGKIEDSHYEIYTKYIEMIENGTLYSKHYKTNWLCLNCGHMHYADTAPKYCPVCEFKQGYFIEQKEH